MKENKDGSYVLDLSEWLEFKGDVEVFAKKKHWWEFPKIEVVEVFVSVKCDSIASVIEQVHDKNKTGILLNNGKYHIVNMPYEKVMELV